MLRRYYAAGAAGDGARGCALLYGLIAETLAEEYAHDPAFAGRSCAVVPSKLFRRSARVLRRESASLRVVAVRVDGVRGVAVLDFKDAVDRRIRLHREADGSWRMLELIDNELP